MNFNDDNGKLYPPTNHDYEPPTNRTPVFQRELEPKEAASEGPKMKFDPETGRPLDQNTESFSGEYYEQTTQGEYHANDYSQNAYNQNQGQTILNGEVINTGYHQNQNQYNTNQYGNQYGNQYANTNGSGYGASKDKGLAIASLVCGIASIPTMCCCGGFILGPVAIILGIVYLSKKQSEGKSMAAAGITCGAIGLIITIAALLTNANVKQDYFGNEFKDEFEKRFELDEDDWDDLDDIYHFDTENLDDAF